MRYIPLWLQKLLLFIDAYPFLSLLGSLSLLLVVFLLLYPVFWPVPVPTPIGDAIAFRPLYVSPGRSYNITLRSKDKNTTFTIREGNEFVIIHEIKEFVGPTPRKKVTIEVVAPPFKRFQTSYARLTVQTRNERRIYIGRVYLRINSLALPIRLLISLLFSAPALQTFRYLAKKLKVPIPFLAR